MKNNALRLFRRAASLLLVFIMIFAFTACKDSGSKQEEIVLPEKKVAILVAPEAQYPEDYKAAMELAAEYPNNVIIKEYTDSRVLRPGDPQILQFSKELAEDEQIGAIIYARATQFTTNAINAAKAVNPDILTLCIEPEESVDKISELATLVLCADWSRAASDMVGAAKDQGAKYFVVFSFNRHITDNPLLRSANKAIEEVCKAQGITYIYESSLDPIYPTLGNAKYFIKEAVARLYNNNKIEGSDVVLFSTDGTVQSTILEVSNEKGFIYISPNFPTAYNGVGEAYEVAYPEKIADVETYIKNAKAAVEADAEGKARISMYANPLASILLEGAVYTSFDLLNGTATAENLAEKASARLTSSADDENFTVEAYSEELGNTFKAYVPGYEKIR